MKKIEFAYSREKLIKLLLPALELLLETEDMEHKKEFFEEKIAKTPIEKDDPLKEVPGDPVLKEIKRKHRSLFFKNLINIDLSNAIIIIVVVLILGLSSLLTCSIYKGPLKTFFGVLSIIFFSLLFALFAFYLCQKFLRKINKLDESHNELVESAEEDYQRQIKRKEEIISNNISIMKFNAHLARQREIYYSNIANWKNSLNDIKGRLALNYCCINETLDFLPERHRNIASVSRLLTILFEGRADKLKEAINLLEDILHKEKLLKIFLEKLT